MAQDHQGAEVPPQVLDYLREHKTVTLATASASGMPHAATMVYATDGLTLYFSTRPESRTARYVAENPRVSFTIDEYYPDWSETKGIQGAGECTQLLDPEEIRHAVELFRKKFGLADPADSLTFFHQLSFFRVTPSEIEFIDTAQAPGANRQALGMEYQRSLVYSIFRDLPRQKVEMVSGQLQTVSYEAGEIIVRQGMPADKFFIIVDGEVTVLRDEGEGPLPLAALRRGQFFGEIAILRDTPRTATVRAATTVTLLTMDRGTFRSLIAQSLSTTQDFDRVIQERLTALGQGTERSSTP